jgi:hypothetical protein
MKKFITIIVALLTIQSVSAWSRAIHAGIAAIADANLTEQAKENIRQALDGRNIVYSAHWMYDMEKTKGYEQTKNWRSVAVAKNNKPLNAKKSLNHKEDIVRRAQGLEALCAAINAIEAGGLTKEQLADNIRYIVTIVADLHCPTHYIYPEALSQRKMHYYYNDKKYSYVGYWENNSIAGTFGWKSNEFVHILNRKSPEKIAEITSGSITSWIIKNAAEYRNIYSLLESGTTFTQSKLRLWQNTIYPISTEIVAVAGYRTAAILNGLFDSNVKNVKIK